MLKMFACILMLIDHSAVALLPPITTQLNVSLVCRMIGRLAMPIFAYQLALGYIYTKNFNKYLLRMIGMTVAAQIPFFLLVKSMSVAAIVETYPNLLVEVISQMNIGWTFILALILLRVTTAQVTPLLKVLVWILVYMLAPYGDYGFYGVMTVAMFYVSIQMEFYPAVMAVLLATITLFFYRHYPIFYSLLQLSCIFAIIPICFMPNEPPNEPNLKLKRYIFYIFYPVHMMVLVIIQQMAGI